MKWNRLSGLWNHQHQSCILRRTAFFRNNFWILHQEFKMLQWHFSNTLLGSCAGPVQSSFVKPRVSSELCCSPTCRCLLRFYWAFCLILHACKHCKVIRSGLIVAGYVFCKSEAMRREIREKYWLRKRKAGRLGKNIEVGAMWKSKTRREKNY